jgi:hypothetical protein
MPGAGEGTPTTPAGSRILDGILRKMMDVLTLGRTVQYGGSWVLHHVGRGDHRPGRFFPVADRVFGGQNAGEHDHLTPGDSRRPGDRAAAQLVTELAAGWSSPSAPRSFCGHAGADAAGVVAYMSTRSARPTTSRWRRPCSSFAGRGGDRVIVQNSLPGPSAWPAWSRRCRFGPAPVCADVVLHLPGDRGGDSRPAWRRSSSRPGVGDLQFHAVHLALRLGRKCWSHRDLAEGRTAGRARQLGGQRQGARPRPGLA